MKDSAHYLSVVVSVVVTVAHLSTCTVHSTGNSQIAISISSFYSSPFLGRLKAMVGHRLRDRKVAGSTPGMRYHVTTLGKLFTCTCLCPPSSRSWHKLQLGHSAPQERCW